MNSYRDNVPDGDSIPPDVYINDNSMYVCPICDEYLGQYENVYINIDDEVIGCKYCVFKCDAFERLDVVDAFSYELLEV